MPSAVNSVAATANKSGRPLKKLPVRNKNERSPTWRDRTLIATPEIHQATVAKRLVGGRQPTGFRAWREATIEGRYA